MKSIISSFFTFFLISAFADDFLPSGLSGIEWSGAYQGEVEIERPLNEVWSYVSNSTKAHEWSVYFHHISPQQSEFKDGEIGSVRRCYRNANEDGAFWDEKIIDLKPLSRRLILSYNFTGYKYQSSTYTTYVLQEYVSISPDRTILKFKTVPTQQMGFFERIIFFFSRSHVEEIFNKNLKNIKNILEGKNIEHHYTNSVYNFFEK